MSDDSAAGSIELVSVTPVSRVSEQYELFPEGKIRWWAGAPRPEGLFYAPGSHAKIERVPGVEPSEQFAVRQVWATPDSRWSRDHRFAFRVRELEQYGRYAFSVTARTNSTEPITIDASGVKPPEEELIPLASPLVQIEPSEEWKEYSATFETGTLTRVHFTTALTTMPTAVEAPWLELDNISITLVEGGVRPAVPDPAPGSLIANGSFEAWPNGADSPLGPFEPPLESYAKLEPTLQQVDDGRIAVHQIWSSSDAGAATMALFRAEVTVQPQTNYTFACRAARAGEGTAVVEVYGKRGNSYEVVSVPLLTIDNSAPGYHTYKATFSSGDYEVVAIATRVPQGVTAFPNRVLWDSWQLQETAP